MTASSYGTHGEPRFADGDAPDVALNPTQAAAYAAKVGNRRVGTTAERTAATGLDVWNGLLWYDTDDGSEYQRVSGVWQFRYRHHYQKIDNTNGTIYARTETGFGKITGDGTVAVSEALTFPGPFSAIPAITVNYMGYRATGAFNMVGLTAASTLVCAGIIPTATGCSVYLENPTGGLLSAINDYYYSWVAIGAA